MAGASLPPQNLNPGSDSSCCPALPFPLGPCWLEGDLASLKWPFPRGARLKMELRAPRQAPCESR